MNNTHAYKTAGSNILKCAGKSIKPSDRLKPTGTNEVKLPVRGSEFHTLTVHLNVSSFICCAVRINLQLTP